MHISTVLLLHGIIGGVAGSLFIWVDIYSLNRQACQQRLVLSSVTTQAWVACAGAGMHHARRLHCRPLSVYMVGHEWCRYIALATTAQCNRTMQPTKCALAGRRMDGWMEAQTLIWAQLPQWAPSSYSAALCGGMPGVARQGVSTQSRSLMSVRKCSTSSWLSSCKHRKEERQRQSEAVRVTAGFLIGMRGAHACMPGVTRYARG